MQNLGTGTPILLTRGQDEAECRVVGFIPSIFYTAFLTVYYLYSELLSPSDIQTSTLPLPWVSER